MSTSENEGSSASVIVCSQKEISLSGGGHPLLVETKCALSSLPAVTQKSKVRFWRPEDQGEGVASYTRKHTQQRLPGQFLGPPVERLE